MTLVNSPLVFLHIDMNLVTLMLQNESFFLLTSTMSCGISFIPVYQLAKRGFSH